MAGMNTGMIALRAVEVAFHGAILGAQLVGDRVVSKPRPDRYVSFFDRVGGALPKLGQILSTRADFVPAHLRNQLKALQDELRPLPLDEVMAILAKQYGQVPFVDVSPTPLGSATVSQVHSASLRDGSPVAIKIMRPRVRERLQLDCDLMAMMGRLVSWLPSLQSIPVNEAISAASESLLAQADFGLEANNARRLRDIFRDDPGVMVPRIMEDLCTERVLCMELLPQMRKFGSPRLDEPTTRVALRAALRSLYRMIFVEGFVHCDLHPGNMGVLEDGRVALFDVGLVAELSPSVRTAFAEFFLAIHGGDSRTAARIVKQTARLVPADIDDVGLEAELDALLCRMGRGTRTGDFQVADFVGELFAIQRRFKVRGTNDFTLAILSLLVMEGVIKEYLPDLDFQQEAVPFLIGASPGRTAT